MKCNEGTENTQRQRQFRAAMGLYPTGVTVVATRRADGQVVGLTINSFNSVSLQPLLVSWNLGCRSQWLDTFLHCAHYSVNVLAAGQVALARQFARRDAPPPAAAQWLGTAAAAPVLRGVVASFKCVNAQSHVAGDHVIFVGRVQDFSMEAQRQPLVFFAGDYHDGGSLRAAVHR